MNMKHKFMYKMNIGTLIVATAALAVMTSAIGTGIFSQHANAAQGCDARSCHLKSTTGCDVGGDLPYHYVRTPSGERHLVCNGVPVP